MFTNSIIPLFIVDHWLFPLLLIGLLLFIIAIWTKVLYASTINVTKSSYIKVLKIHIIHKVYRDIFFERQSQKSNTKTVIFQEVHFILLISKTTCEINRSLQLFSQLLKYSLLQRLKFGFYDVYLQKIFTKSAVKRFESIS